VFNSKTVAIIFIVPF